MGTARQDHRLSRLFGLLVVTAVSAEADAVLSALGASTEIAIGSLPVRRAHTAIGHVDVVAGGVGVAHAAASAAFALAGADYDLVLSAGIAGGFPGIALGAVVVADSVVHADLGAQDGRSFRAASQLGLGPERIDLDAATTAELARRCSGRVGAVLSVSTVTGTASTCTQRLRRSPDALAEAMEGAGVLAAAQLGGVPFGEIRAISNAVGPRDRSSWQIAPALSALGQAIADVTAAPWP